MKRIIWIITGIVISAGLIVALANFRSAQHSRGLTAELSVRNRTLETKIAAAREQLAARTHDADTLQAELQEAQTPKPPATSLAQKPTPARHEIADLMDTRPTLRALFKQSNRANLGLTYQPFYAAAHLSPDQINKFEELMTENEQDRLDLQAAAKAQGLSAKNPALEKMRQQSEEKLQSALKENLSDAEYRELQRYNQQKPLSGLLTSFASVLAYEGAPITAPQCGQLLDIFSNASSQFQSGGRAELTSIDSKHVLQQAEQILSPFQFAALQANANIIELTKLRAEFYQQKNAAAK